MVNPPGHQAILPKVPRYLELTFLAFLSLYVEINHANQINTIDLEERNINAAQFDNRGMLWVATDEGLIAKANQSTFHFTSEITDSNSLIDSEVSSLAKTHDGNIVAVSESGLSFFQNSAFQHV